MQKPAASPRGRFSQLKTGAKADVVKQLLPIIDNFERALKHVPEDPTDNDYVKGVHC